jgi:hypothetical protein
MKEQSLNRFEGGSCGSAAGDDTTSPEPREQESPHLMAEVDPMHLLDVESKYLSLNRESTW